MHNELAMTKVSTRLLSYLLTFNKKMHPDDHMTRKSNIEADLAGLRERFLTYDECRVHHRVRDKETTRKHATRSKGGQSHFMYRRGDGIIFGDAKGVVFIDKRTKRVLIHQNNAPAQNPLVSMATVRGCSFELVDDPLYTLDLAPSEYHLFPNMKK